MSDIIIKADGLTKKFPLDSGFFARQDRFVYAVNDVSFEIGRGKTYGLVGESGSGKTTAARLLIQMYKEDSGKILFDGKDVGTFSKHELKTYREKVKYIFQDPGKSLNPRMNIGGILTSAYRFSSLWPGRKKAEDEAAELLEEVGLDPKDIERRPAEFSGGQRQRISIARALIMKPEVLICDEIVSALDVSVQGQILNLLVDLKKRRNLSFLFIAHDLRVSCYFCDTIGVMYSGMIMEEAPAENLYKNALHPYTKLLFSSNDGKSMESRNTAVSEIRDTAVSEIRDTAVSEIRTVLEPLKSCPFAPRCPKATEKCRAELPALKEIEPGHKVRCFYL